MFVVFDLDGTLSLPDHRLHHIRGPEKNYDAFYAACGGDAPNGPALATMAAHLTEGHRVEVWTGRREDARHATDAWFRRHGYLFGGLVTRMRPERDFRPAVELKRRWLRDVRLLGDVVPTLAYDDDAAVVAMWREEGVPCFQVS